MGVCQTGKNEPFIKIISVVCSGMHNPMLRSGILLEKIANFSNCGPSVMTISVK
jgi:hypothetical protein